MSPQPAGSTAVQPSSERRFFTLEEANRALAYVGPVVEDIHRTYRNAIELQNRLESSPEAAEDRALNREYEGELKTLQRFVDELRGVGVELKDFDMGLIDFPALHDGREVCLCWKRGEGRIAAWHETDAGFSGRKDVTLLEQQKV